MGQFIDLTGMKFGEITVLRQDYELTKQTKRVHWVGQCSCGRTKSWRTDQIKKLKTCGQCANDLTNQRFGRLVALKKGKKDKAQHQYWICRCDCGNIVEVNSDNLRRGMTHSCGCLHSELIHQTRFKDLTGERFGKLVALDYEIIDNKTYWRCQCDCGNITIVARTNLLNGHTQSCGCIATSIGEQNIVNLLTQNNIIFEREKIFSDLPNRRFDFYLPLYNRVIEFDGRQHFQSCSWYNTEQAFQNAVARDIEKNKYCFNKKIEIVRIPYTERDHITLDMILGSTYLMKAPDMEEAQDV